MNFKQELKYPLKVKGEFDSLSMYHHVTCDFEAKLSSLLSILEQPKESNLHERFKKIESLLDNTFRLELLHLLSLNSAKKENMPTESEHHLPHPEILLHFWCLLECTDSLNYIAEYLALTVEEVRELIRELDHAFTIDSLIFRIRQHYVRNKYLREFPELQKRNEQLGLEFSLIPQNTTEERKQRLRRRYGHLSTVFDLMCHTV